MTPVLKVGQDTFAITEEPTNSLLIPYPQNVISHHFHVKTMTNSKLENASHVDLALDKNVEHLDTTQINPKAEEVYTF